MFLSAKISLVSFISVAFPPVTGIVYNFEDDLFSSTEGVETLKTTFFASLEMPRGVTLPNFHNNSGDITFCPIAFKLIIIKVVNTTFFIINYSIFCGAKNTTFKIQLVKFQILIIVKILNLPAIFFFATNSQIFIHKDYQNIIREFVAKKNHYFYKKL